MVVGGQDEGIPLLPQSSTVILRFLPSHKRQEFVQGSVLRSYLVLHRNVPRNLHDFHPEIVDVNNLILSLAFHLLREGPRFFCRILLKLVLHVGVYAAVLSTLGLQIWLHGVFSLVEGSDSAARDLTLLWQKVLNLFDANVLGVHIDAIPQQYFVSLLSYFEQVLVSLASLEIQAFELLPKCRRCFALSFSEG